MAGAQDLHLQLDDVPIVGDITDDCTISGDSAHCTLVFKKPSGGVVTRVVTQPMKAVELDLVSELPSNTDAGPASTNVPGNGAMGMKAGSLLGVLGAVGCVFAVLL